MEQQKERMRALETMIENFNDGRSRSFFCRAAALLDLTTLTSSLDEATRNLKADPKKQTDVKNKAKTLKAILNKNAFKEGVELTVKR